MKLKAIIRKHIFRFLVIAIMIVSRYKETLLLLLGCLIGTVCLAVFCFSDNIIIKIIFLIAEAVTFDIVFPIVTSVSAKRKIKNSGTTMGFILTSAFTGNMVFQLINGYVSEYFGRNYIPFIALAGAISCLISSFFLSSFNNRKKI